MAYIPFVFSKDTVTFFVNGVPYSVDKSFPSYPEVLAELREHQTNPAHADTERLIALTRPVVAVQAAVDRAESRSTTAADYLPRGVVSVTSSEIRYNGEPVHGVLVDRILGLLAEGFDIMPMVRFLENLYQNPADFARDELYLWLETSNLPITEDGHFLAYKNVNGDFTSIHDGRTKNDPGTVVSMPRQDVDPVRDRTCSRGLHFCSKSYLPHFSSGRNNKVILLKINPADVVSIPSDYNNAKGRAWKYLVLSVVGEDPQSKVWPSVVGPNAEQVVLPRSEDAPLEIPSDLSKALFAALNEIGIKDRDDRLNFAEEALDTADAYASIDSFNDLTVKQASTILEYARKIKAENDEAAAVRVQQAARDAEAALIAATQKVDKARQAKIDAINGYGIETLRRLASQSGFTAATGRNAYKGARKDELVRFLIAQVK
jgi:hypothetical protein